MVSTWPLPVSATKPIPERVPDAPVQLTVHSICSYLYQCRLCGVNFSNKAQQKSNGDHFNAASQQFFRYTEAIA
jgi:hypothetical protein